MPVFNSIHMFFYQCVYTVFILVSMCFGQCLFLFYSHMFVIGVLMLFSSWSLCVLDSACFSFYSPIFFNGVLILFSSCSLCVLDSACF